MCTGNRSPVPPVRRPGLRATGTRGRWRRSGSQRRSAEPIQAQSRPEVPTGVGGASLNCATTTVEQAGPTSPLQVSCPRGSLDHQQREENAQRNRYDVAVSALTRHVVVLREEVAGLTASMRTMVDIVKKVHNQRVETDAKTVKLLEKIAGVTDSGTNFSDVSDY